MLLTILGFILLVIGIVCIVYIKKHFPFTEDWVDLIGFASVFIGAIMFITCFIMAFTTQIGKDVSYQNMLERKTAIEYRLEQIENNDKNVMTNGGVYNDILKYNREIRGAKNPWTNWFYVQEIADLDYIPLPNGS